MRRLVIAVTALLLLPAAAQAGGWATVGMDSTPSGVKPGGKWKPKITVMQHGRTPLEGVEPAVIIVKPDGTEQRFAARPTKEPGVYTTTVTFPTAGRYDYKVDDGFGNAGNPDMHSFGAVMIGAPTTTGGPAPARPAPAPSAADSGFPWLPILLAAIGAAVMAAIGMAIVRRRRGAGGLASA